jgi:hypothetical protein
MPVKGRDSKTLEISPLDRLSQFFYSFSVSGGKVSAKHVTQGFSPDSSLRARGPHGPAVALKG